MRYLLFLLLTLCLVKGSDLKTQIEALDKRLKEQEERLSFAHKESSFTLGGRIQLDAVINQPSVNASGGANTYDYYLTPNSFSDNANIDKISAHAKSSRLWFKTRRKTPLGTLRSLVEIDFWGSSGNEKVTNSHNPRLRHAYVSLNNWTLGQTYTTFMGNSLPDIILLSSDVVFVRQPLVRYSIKKQDLFFDIAFENPETTLLPLDTNTTTSYNDDPFFDTIARVRYEGKRTKAAFSALLRPISIEKNRELQSKLAWGINTSLKYIFANNDYLQTSLATGKGLGRYIALGFFPAGEFDTNNIELLPVSSGHLSYTHRFSKKLRSTLLASTIKTHTMKKFQFLQPEQTSVLHANLRYAPFSKALITLEYAVGQRVSPAITRQELQRLMTSFSYIF